METVFLNREASDKLFEAVETLADSIEIGETRDQLEALRDAILHQTTIKLILTPDE